MLRLMVVVLFLFSTSPLMADKLRVGTFAVDASPPVGSPLAYDPTVGIQLPLSCRGIVIVGAGEPIVLCAIDWIGISSGGHQVFRERLGEAAGTTAARVAVHTLHQHDAPRCDFSADELLQAQGLGGTGFDTAHARDVLRRASLAVTDAVSNAVPVTHVGLGEGTVEKVASNRRILGPDGKVLHTRYTATANPKIRAFPAGTIDPQLKLLSFWNEDEPVAVLTWYATHPQSYYRTGLANPDFPGMARNARQDETGVPHIHFNGAGGNIGAGKWNDGSPENRQILADRVADGMRKAWENVDLEPVSAEDVDWQVESVVLPVADHLDEEQLLATVQNSEADNATRWYAAKNLVWLRRCKVRDPIDISCLSVGRARVLHMPGELFVEYQLAAQQVRPDLFVAMAAYGDYAPGYIGTEVAYGQGGYETSERASRVAPEVEHVLMEAVRSLLKN
uniref:hypothetical protein n=1 Tax=Maioricimonas rarisocia TaxID=2528026 RepID=UPI0018D24BF1|nr:hypothetical protein [Maioricimonas rarisocia]